MNIVVTGSLGHIGKPLAEALVQKGHSVTVISSNPDRRAAIEAIGATAAIGSVEDVEFLTATFRGADVVHAMIPPTQAAADPIAHNRHIGDCLVNAIEQSGVKRVVYISSYGADLPAGTGLIVGHYHIEQALNAVPTLEALTHLRATYIYYNLYAYVGMIKKAGFIGANYGGDDRVVLVSPADIAAAAVAEIETQAPGRQVTYVASDERTCDEIAQVLGKAIGKPDLSWVMLSDEDFQRGLEANGVPTTAAVQLTELYGACHTGLLNLDYDRHKPETMGSVKLDDFAREFAAVYEGKQ